MGEIHDVLKPGLKVVFCGTAMSKKAELIGAYYTGPGNKFWPMLRKLGLIPVSFDPLEYRRLPEYGIGLTNLAKCPGRDHEIPRGAFDAGSLRDKILQYKPDILAFNGKRAAMEFFGERREYGRQEGRMGRTAFFVLPSASGAANGFWDAGPWLELSAYVNFI